MKHGNVRVGKHMCDTFHIQTGFQTSGCLLSPTLSNYIVREVSKNEEAI